MPKKAVYPGSFDPMTFGHLDIIERVAPMFDELIVLVAQSHSKSYLFSAEERAQLVRDSLPKGLKVKVDLFDGLTVDYAKKASAQFIIRGLRAMSDFENEFAMANMNKSLNAKIETLVVFTKPEYSHIASRMVKEVAHHGGDLSQMVPDVVVAAVAKKLKRGKSI